MTTPFVFSGCDLWARLSGERRPILLYGMGNGADKILAVLAQKNIPVAGVFASDGFVRGQVFHGHRVRTFSEVFTAYPENGCVVLVAFGSARPEVMENVRRVAARYPTFVPDVPISGAALFDDAFVRAHGDEFASARQLLADDASRALFDDLLTAKRTGDFAALARAVSPAESDWQYLTPKNIRRAADLGAYTGDTARELLSRAPLEFLLCAEPDARSFKKLSAFAATITKCTVECHRAAVGAENGTAAFAATGNRGAALAATGEKTPLATPDALLAGRPVDYLKYDVEGAEADALLGTRETIAAFAPRARVACYHRSEDLFALPLLLHRLAPRHRLYLCRRAGFPAWDVDLIATP